MLPFPSVRWFERLVPKAVIQPILGCYNFTRTAVAYISATPVTSPPMTPTETEDACRCTSERMR